MGAHLRDEFAELALGCGLRRHCNQGAKARVAIEPCGRLHGAVLTGQCNTLGKNQPSFARNARAHGKPAVLKRRLRGRAAQTTEFGADQPGTSGQFKRVFKLGIDAVIEDVLKRQPFDRGTGGYRNVHALRRLVSLQAARAGPIPFGGTGSGQQHMRIGPGIDIDAQLIAGGNAAGRMDDDLLPAIGAVGTIPLEHAQRTDMLAQQRLGLAVTTAITQLKRSHPGRACSKP